MMYAEAPPTNDRSSTVVRVLSSWTLVGISAVASLAMITAALAFTGRLSGGQVLGPAVAGQQVIVESDGLQLLVEQDKANPGSIAFSLRCLADRDYTLVRIEEGSSAFASQQDGNLQSVSSSATLRDWHCVSPSPVQTFSISDSRYLPAGTYRWFSLATSQTLTSGATFETRKGQIYTIGKDGLLHVGAGFVFH
jgi:hypothetical protein